MKKSPGKKGKSNTLDLRWDTKFQLFEEQQKKGKKTGIKKRNLEDYLDFLSDIEPAFPETPRKRLADKQFTLY